MQIDPASFDMLVTRRGLFVDQSSQDADSGTDGRQSAFKLNSVGAQFRSQLKGLMATLKKCQPHYVRCVEALHPIPYNESIGSRHYYS